MPLILDGTNGISDVRSTTDGSATTPAIRGTDANTGIFFPAADTIAFGEGGAESMRIDASGNVGIGITPSAYGTNFKAIQLGLAGNIGSQTAARTIEIASNAYNNSGWKYQATDVASLYYQYAGKHVWSNAASGTAGNAVTFTEAMTLDNNNNLLIGTTSSLGSVGRIQAVQSAAGAAGAAISADATSATFSYSIAYLNSTRAASSAFNFISCTSSAYVNPQFRVTGDGVIYAANTTVQALSDQRLKENIRNASEGLNVITALRPVRYDWKEGYGNDRKNQLGFLAQEFEQVFPEAVSEWKGDKDSTAYKTVGPAALIPVLVKAIQEQQAIINDLKSRIETLEST